VTRVKCITSYLWCIITKKYTKIFFQVQPKRCNITQFIYFSEMLYMFQAVPPPIIRSSKLYIQHRVLCQTFTVTCHCRGRVGTVQTLYRQCWAPDDGWRNRLKHVEHFTEIKKLCNVASYWLYLKIRLRCTDSWTSNLHKNVWAMQWQ
jgi:hypothetical protein